MALQIPPRRAYAGNPDRLVIQVIQITLSMPEQRSLYSKVLLYQCSLPEL